LHEAVDLLDGIPGIAFCRFGPGDVIRHRLVRKIIEAYERVEKGPSSRQGRRSEATGGQAR
jgi:phosphate starvation-inducible PhoH-like protein